MPDFLSKSTEDELRRMMAKMRSLNMTSERGGHVRASTPFTDLVQFELRADETIPGGEYAPFVSTAKMIGFSEDSELYYPVETAEPIYKLHWSLAPRKVDDTYWNVTLLREYQRVWCTPQFGRWEIVWPYDFSVYCKLDAVLQGIEDDVDASVWERIDGSWTDTGKNIKVLAPPWWDVSEADEYLDGLPADQWIRATYHAASRLWFVTDRPREIMAVAQLTTDLEKNSSANAKLHTYGSSGWSLSNESVTVVATPALKRTIKRNTNIHILFKPEWNIWILNDVPAESTSLRWGTLNQNLQGSGSQPAGVVWEGNEPGLVHDWRLPASRQKVPAGARILGIAGREEEIDNQGNPKMYAVVWPLKEIDSVIDVGACPDPSHDNKLTKKQIYSAVASVESDPLQAPWEDYHTGYVCMGDEAPS